MKNGKLQMIGEPKRVVDAYMQDVTEEQEAEFRGRKEAAAAAVSGPPAEAEIISPSAEKADAAVEPAPAAEDASSDGRREQRWGKREVEIKQVVLKNNRGEEKHVFHPGDGMIIEMDIEAKEPVKDFVFGIGVFTSMGIMCYGTNTNLEEYESVAFSGEGKVVCRIEELPLINGTYYLDLAVHKRDGYPYDYHRNMYTFLVSSMIRDEGIARLAHTWEFSPEVSVKQPAK